MKVGVIGAGTMGQGIAKAFAQNEGYEVALCDIKQEWAEGGKEKIAKGYDRLSVIMKRVILGSVMVIGLPCSICSTHKGITEPREAITLP